MCFPCIILLDVVNVQNTKALKTLLTSKAVKLLSWFTYDFWVLGLLYWKLMSTVGKEAVFKALGNLVYLFCISFEVCTQSSEYINSYFREYFSIMIDSNYTSLRGWKNIFLFKVCSFFFNRTFLNDSTDLQKITQNGQNSDFRREYIFQ